MQTNRLLLSAATFALFLSILGPTTEPARGACLSIGTPEVDFGQRFLGTDPKTSVNVKNECGENVEITATGFIPYNLDMDLTKKECTPGKILAANKTCLLEFTYNPTVVGKSKALMGVYYFSVKLQEQNYQFWVTGTGKKILKVNKPGPFSAAGELGIAVSVFSLSCPASGGGELWNEGEEEAAIGELSSLSFSPEGCETNIPGCSVATATAMNLPWKAGAREALDLFDLNAIEIKFGLGATCILYGLPSTITAVGSVAGVSENSPSCIEFNESPGLVVNGAFPATLSGELCFTEPEGLEFE